MFGGSDELNEGGLHEARNYIVRKIRGSTVRIEEEMVLRADEGADEVYPATTTEDGSHRARPGTRTLPWSKKRAVVVHIMSRRGWVVRREHVADRAAEGRSRQMRDAF